MNMTRPLATVAAVALMTSFGASTATATTITIDNFNVNQLLQSAADGNPATSTVTGPEADIIGGVRHMQVATENLEGADLAIGTQFNAEGGNLAFANDPTSIGSGWLVYDGTEDRGGLASPAIVSGLAFGATVNPFGIDADLLLGAPTGFFTFLADNFDQPQLNFSAFAWDMHGNTVAYFEEVDPATFNPILGYDQFRADWNDPLSGLGGFDFSRVGALAFRVDSVEKGFDGQIRGIVATPIPLPAAAFLLLGGLGGLAGVSFVGKRRRKS